MTDGPDPWVEQRKIHETLTPLHVRAEAAVRDALVPDDTQVGPRPNYCYNCSQQIRAMVFRGTGWCSESCRKALGDG